MTTAQIPPAARYQIDGAVPDPVRDWLASSFDPVVQIRKVMPAAHAALMPHSASIAGTTITDYKLRDCWVKAGISKGPGRRIIKRREASAPGDFGQDVAGAARSSLANQRRAGAVTLPEVIAQLRVFAEFEDRHRNLLRQGRDRLVSHISAPRLRRDLR
jgi:hypothetical protein